MIVSFPSLLIIVQLTLVLEAGKKESCTYVLSFLPPSLRRPSSNATYSILNDLGGRKARSSSSKLILSFLPPSLLYHRGVAKGPRVKVIKKVVEQVLSSCTC